MSGRSVTPRALGAAGVAIVLALALAGCVDQQNSAAPSDRPVPSASPTPTPTAKPVVLVPDGAADDNVAYFRRIGHRLLDHNQNLKGKAIVDAFVKAGFDKKNMELTPDKTSIGLDAWNIEWSVKFGNTCLIGQAGNTKFHYFTGPVLSTGKCLFGTTRPINW